MTGGDDRRLQTAVAQFSAVMLQSQMAGPQRDAIDVQVNAANADGSQSIRVTYTTTSVIGTMDRGTGEASVRQGSSVKVDATIRLVCPENPAEAVQMEIAGKLQPFDPSDARLALQRILMDEARRAFATERKP